MQGGSVSMVVLSTGPCLCLRMYFWAYLTQLVASIDSLGYVLCLPVCSYSLHNVASAAAHNNKLVGVMWQSAARPKSCAVIYLIYYVGSGCCTAQRAVQWSLLTYIMLQVCSEHKPGWVSIFVGHLPAGKPILLWHVPDYLHALLVHPWDGAWQIMNVACVLSNARSLCMGFKRTKDQLDEIADMGLGRATMGMHGDIMWRVLHGPKVSGAVICLIQLTVCIEMAAACSMACSQHLCGTSASVNGVLCR